MARYPSSLSSYTHSDPRGSAACCSANIGGTNEGAFARLRALSAASLRAGLRCLRRGDDRDVDHDLIASGHPLYVVKLDAATRRVMVGPRAALRMDRIRLRDVNWIGDGALDRAIGDGLEIFVRVRSTRAPQPAWLRGLDGRYEVELVACEEGVSPGQACVFYDAPSGQARVLGGGFIRSAAARRDARRLAEAPSAADLKSLPHSRQDRVQGLQIESGTRIIIY